MKIKLNPNPAMLLKAPLLTANQTVATRRVKVNLSWVGGASTLGSHVVPFIVISSKPLKLGLIQEFAGDSCFDVGGL